MAHALAGQTEWSMEAVDLLLANYRADGTLRNMFIKYGADPASVDALKLIGY